MAAGQPGTPTLARRAVNRPRISSRSAWGCAASRDCRAARSTPSWSTASRESLGSRCTRDTNDEYLGGLPAEHPPTRPRANGGRTWHNPTREAVPSGVHRSRQSRARRRGGRPAAPEPPRACRPRTVGRGVEAIGGRGGSCTHFPPTIFTSTESLSPSPYGRYPRGCCCRFIGWGGVSGAPQQRRRRDFRRLPGVAGALGRCNSRMRLGLRGRWVPRGFVRTSRPLPLGRFLIRTHYAYDKLF